jgi:hypothetical protein
MLPIFQPLRFQQLKMLLLLLPPSQPWLLQLSENQPSSQ